MPLQCEATPQQFARLPNNLPLPQRRRRRADGTDSVRSVSQLSGGEWRRLGFALSLAFADFSRARLGLSCSYVVFDEAMQHMDADGQAAMATLLQGLEYDTAVVIAHGLASDELYGAFDAIDVVEKVRRPPSILHLARSLARSLAEPLGVCAVAGGRLELCAGHFGALRQWLSLRARPIRLHVSCLHRLDWAGTVQAVKQSGLVRYKAAGAQHVVYGLHSASARAWPLDVMT